MSNASALTPFKYQTFTIMWLAALISNIGTWMHSVGAGWMMTELSPSPLLIALVQTATALPVFLFALPAGALADIFNRRTILIASNVVMLIAALLFVFIVLSGQVSTYWLLIFTFLLGTGSAFMAPAWQAVIPKMVPKGELPQAVALGGISINLSRAVGPALAGILITSFGISSPFLVNAFTFIIILLALWWWNYKVENVSQNNPPERIWSAMRVGIRYSLFSQPLKNTIWHVFGFMFFANAFWGLLPILSKDQLNGNAALFGFLMGAIGFGAVIGALFLPKLRSVFNANQLVLIGTIGTSLVTAIFSVAQNQILALCSSFIFGISWIFVLATVNVSAQQALPDWVRGRGLAIFMMIFFGSMSLGATFWGWLASHLSISTTMLYASIGGLIFVILANRSELQQGKDIDFTPSHHWPEPHVHSEIKKETGPVMIQITYQILEHDRSDFLKSLYELQNIRKRDGAYNWDVFEDIENKGSFVENFVEASWQEHLRHHDRVTNADKEIQNKVNSYHQDKSKPVVKHFLAVN